MAAARDEMRECHQAKRKNRTGFHLMVAAVCVRCAERAHTQYSVCVIIRFIKTGISGG